MPLKAGQLRHRVRIDRMMYRLDSAGEIIQDPETGEIIYDWRQVGPWAWARIAPLSGREFIQSAEMQSQVTARITVRAGIDVAAKDRIVHISTVTGATIYDIHAILEDPDSGLEYKTLLVSRGVNQG